MHGADRAACLTRLQSVLNELVIEGVPTTIALHAALAADASVAAGNIDTRFLEGWLPSQFP